MNLLSVTQLVVDRGPTPVIDRLDIAVEPAEAVCVLGRNGMGKTTLLRAIMGISRARSGQVTLDGRNITKCLPYEVARAGIGYVPQGRGIFPEHTVEENLLITVSPRAHGEEHDRIFRLFPRLLERRSQAAGTLSGGEQQMLAIARALTLAPRLLLLDEPTEGLQPSIIKELGNALASIRHEMGVALLLIEQNLDFTFGCTSRGYVLERGRVVASGSIEELRHDAIVRDFLAV